MKTKKNIKSVGLSKEGRRRLVLPIVSLGCIGVGFGLIGGWIGLTYKSFIWQVLDALFVNLSLAVRSDLFTQVMVTASNTGYYGVGVVWLMMLGMLIVMKEKRLILMSLAWSVGGMVLGLEIKQLISRLRPERIALIAESSYSMPSLHALNVMILFLALTYFVYHLGRKLWQGYVVFLAGLMVSMMIGWSRIYLGVHYFSDVVAGYAFAVSWFCIVLMIEKASGLIEKYSYEKPKI